MSKKATNWLFLVFLAIEAAVIILLQVTRFNLGIIGSLILNQLIFLLPAVCFLIKTKTAFSDVAPHKKLHPATPFLCIVFTGLCIPLITVVNVISQLFVSNAANQIGVALAGTPAWLIILVVGILGPMNEEFIYRGVFYQSYRKTGRVPAAIVMSAFLFGLMHLNFNQMSYAFVVGIMGALLVEATGSIVSTMIFHACINTSSSVLMVLQKDMLMETGGDTQALIEGQLVQMGFSSYEQYLMVMIIIYGITALFTTALAVLLLNGMAAIEGRGSELRDIFKRKQKCSGEGKKTSLWSVPLVIAVVLSFLFMIVTYG